MQYKKGSKVRLKSMDNLYRSGFYGIKGSFQNKDEVLSEKYLLTLVDRAGQDDHGNFWSCSWTDKKGNKHNEWMFHEKDFATKPTIVIRNKND